MSEETLTTPLVTPALPNDTQAATPPDYVDPVQDMPAVETSEPPATAASENTPPDAPESQSDEAAVATSNDTAAPADPTPADDSPASAAESEPTVLVNGEALTAIDVAALLVEVQRLRGEHDELVAIRAELAERRAAG